jgi:hypothetical protein
MSRFFGLLGRAAVIPCALGCSGGSSTGWADDPDAVGGSATDGGAEASFDETGSSFAATDAGTGAGTGSCKQGSYSGTFTCTFDPDGGTTPSTSAGAPQITGTITLTLAQSPAGEFVDVASGKFTADTTSLISATADLSGTLDCNTGKFTGQLTNGAYHGWIFINGTFQGPLASGYDGTTSAFVDGTWVMMIPNAGTCPGTWSAKYVGP